MSEQYQVPQGVQITGKYTPEFAEILTPEALEFVVTLQRKFNKRRLELLQARVERQKTLDAGQLPDFLPETKCNNVALGGWSGSRWGEDPIPTSTPPGNDYFFVAPRRRPRPATVFFGPLRVRELVRVRCPRAGKLRR